MTGYQPISCQTYAELELAVMHKDHLRVAWHGDDGRLHVAQLIPSDLQTRNHEEYLLATDSDGEPLEIRLDRIHRFEKI